MAVTIRQVGVRQRDDCLTRLSIQIWDGKDWETLATVGNAWDALPRYVYREIPAWTTTRLRLWNLRSSPLYGTIEIAEVEVFEQPVDPPLNWPVLLPEMWPAAADLAERRGYAERRRAEWRQGFDDGDYRRPDLRWYQEAVTEYFAFVFDRRIYQPDAGWRILPFLEEMSQEIGLIDILVLWQAYPRIGNDPRNQFDFYRELPGGVEELRRQVRAARERGTHVFIDYNPWDTGTRREGVSDAEALGRIAAEMDIDGIFLDVSSDAGNEFRDAVDRHRPGVVFAPEGLPREWGMRHTTGGWVQIYPRLKRLSAVLTPRFVEPRFSARWIDRHVLDNRDYLSRALFNGCGLVVWENIFGYFKPWSAADKAGCREVASILRRFKDNFASPDWVPFVPTRSPEVGANWWPARECSLWTLVNEGERPVDGPVLPVGDARPARFWDVRAGRELHPERVAGELCLPIHLGARGAGCVQTFFAPDRTGYSIPSAARAPEELAFTRSADLRPAPVTPVGRGLPQPADMVRVSGGPFLFKAEHRDREGACYDDVETWDRHDSDGQDWGAGTAWVWTEHPPHPVVVDDFLIDRTPVTKSAYRGFLRATGYRPSFLERFLDDWSRPPGDPERMDPAAWEPPQGQGNHPVVYVDLDDARAFARWAGKRLPTEEEWQYAAQAGASDRAWPWGLRWETGRCNEALGYSTPVDAFPAGANPLGILDLVGNVWQLTESERNDGITRYGILKGGSFYKLTQSRYYMDGGPQPLHRHAKFLLMYPGLDRTSTIGFRCARDL